MSESRFFLRPTQANDAPALNALYRRLTGIERTIDQWRWEWIDCPEGPAPSWVIVDRASDAVVGHHGVVPIALRLGASPIIAARTENSMVEPSIRTRLRYPAMEARLLAELLKRFELIYTTAGKGPQGELRKRLGYRPAAQWRTFTAGTTPGYVAGRIAGRAGAALLGPVGRLVGTATPDQTLVDADDIAAVAKLVAGWSEPAAIAPVRSAEFLRWRLTDHPFHGTRLGLVRRGDATVAFIAWHEAAGPGGTLEVHVDDLVAAGNDAHAMRDALRLLHRRYRDRPARVLVRALGATADRLEALGFNAPPGNGAELLVRSQRVPSDTAWEGTMLIAEGI
jgi:hypothetical protein